MPNKEEGQPCPDCYECEFCCNIVHKGKINQHKITCTLRWAEEAEEAFKSWLSLQPADFREKLEKGKGIFVHGFLAGANTAATLCLGIVKKKSEGGG